MAPKVSIVTPVHNAEKYLEETLDSILAQTETDWHLLAVNDHSTDGSLEILNAYASKDDRITILQSDKYGAAEARNLALRQADGDFIAFLDSDDIWLPRKLELQIAFMEEHSFDFSYTPYDYINEHSELEGMRRYVPKTVDYRSSLDGCRIGCLTVIYRRSAAPYVQAADLKKRNDDALWLKVFRQIDTGHRYNKILALYRRSSASLSSGPKIKLLKYHYKLYRLNESFGPLKSLYFTFQNILVYLDIKLHWEKSIDLPVDHYQRCMKNS